MTGTALVSYQERFEADADALAEREARAGVALSTQGGVFSLAGQPLGPSVYVVVLDSYYEYNFFNPNYAFQRENPLPPMCYSFGRDKEMLAPFPGMQSDPSWFWPQNAKCDGTCPLNRWGSSSRGRGKACQNRERLVVIPCGYLQPPVRGRGGGDVHLFEDPEHYAKADAISLRLPVTSVENWSRYVTTLASAHRRPPYAVFTEITIKPDPKSQFRLHFEMVDLCPEALFETITRRVDAALQQPFVAYTAPTAEQIQAALAPPHQQAQTAGGWGPRR